MPIGYQEGQQYTALTEEQREIQSRPIPDLVATRQFRSFSLRNRAMQRPAKPIAALVLIAALVMMSAATLAQYGVQKGEWPNFGGDLGSTKYSPLDQITGDNFGQLKVAWRWTSPDGFLARHPAAASGGRPRAQIFDELKRDDRAAGATASRRSSPTSRRRR